MTFKDRREQRKICETMSSLLSPLKNHCDKNTKECIEITLRILQELEVEKNEK